MSVTPYPEKIKFSLVIIVKITTVLNASRPISTSHPSKSYHFIYLEPSSFVILIPLNKKNEPKVGNVSAAIINVFVCLAKAQP